MSPGDAVKDTTGVPWRWICKIDVADSRGRPAGSGTGVLISNKHVLTAAHVVYDAYKNMQQYTITVIPALNDLDEPFDRYSLASKPKIRQEYDPAAADSLDWDYALLTLSTAVGEKKFKALNGQTPLLLGKPSVRREHRVRATGSSHAQRQSGIHGRVPGRKRGQATLVRRGHPSQRQ